MKTNLLQRMEKSDDPLIRKFTKEIPLETRIKVSVEMYYLANHWNDIFPVNLDTQEMMSMEEQRDAVLRLAQPLIGILMQNINEWKQDGCPVNKDGKDV